MDLAPLLLAILFVVFGLSYRGSGGCGACTGKGACHEQGGCPKQRSQDEQRSGDERA